MQVWIVYRGAAVDRETGAPQWCYLIGACSGSGSDGDGDGRMMHRRCTMAWTSLSGLNLGLACLTSV